jgi:glyoxalase family protein
MTPTLLGLHHVTAMTGDAQANIDFYTGTLGLRLVKLTVNFDDPTSYHLYYGDGVGSPGSIMTFFVWPGANRGRHGTGQTAVTAFSIPATSLEFWRGRLRESGVAIGSEEDRFGERVLSFPDPDGLTVELVGTTRRDPRTPWERGGVPTDHAIRGFHGVTISEEGYETSAELLTKTMGFARVSDAVNRFRYSPTTLPDSGVATFVDLLCQPDARRGTMGVGTVHHTAFRTPDDAQQGQWLQTIRGLRLNVSPVMDRKYFHSIYYREPGGVLFEIATDPPGFTVDEPLEKLGSGLYLPPWLEPHRKELEAILPKIKLPQT